MAVINHCCFCESFGNDFTSAGMAIVFLFGFVVDLLGVFLMSLETQLQRQSLSYQAQS